MHAPESYCGLRGGRVGVYGPSLKIKHTGEGGVGAMLGDNRVLRFGCRGQHAFIVVCRYIGALHLSLRQGF